MDIEKYDKSHLPKMYWWMLDDEANFAGQPINLNIGDMVNPTLIPQKGLFDIFTSPTESGNNDFRSFWNDGVVSSAAAESVSVTITPSTVTNPLSEGVLIRIKGIKRVWGEVIQAGNISVTIKPIYRPAPKSRLNNTRTPFSKIKHKIVKLK